MLEWQLGTLLITTYRRGWLIRVLSQTSSPTPKVLVLHWHSLGIDKSHADDDAAGAEERHVFGEAARRALARDKKPTISKDPSSMIRELIRTSSSVAENGNDVDDKSKNVAAFFRHLSELACDASSSHPSKLRSVVSVPVTATPEVYNVVSVKQWRHVSPAFWSRSRPIIVSRWLVNRLFVHYRELPQPR
jgi:hypothetical protein